MFGKQALVDLVIVMTIPLLVLGGYFVWFRNAQSTEIVSPTAWLDKNEVAANQPGAKTEAALKILRSIRLDDSLFKDPAYLILKTYVVNIPEVPLSRPFPFTAPPAVLERINNARGKTALTDITPAAKIDTTKKAK